MQYIDALWRHESATDPVRLVSEIDAERWEVRKLEFFANGEIGVACEHFSNGSTRLGEMEVPSLEQINSEPEFSAKYIEKTEFDELWSRYANVG